MCRGIEVALWASGNRFPPSINLKGLILGYPSDGAVRPIPGIRGWPEGTGIDIVIRWPTITSWGDKDYLGKPCPPRR